MSAREKLSASSTTLGARIATRAPFSKAAQISKVEASKAGLLQWAMQSLVSICAKPLLITKRITARCGTITPFGWPVEPEVYITYAASSPLICGLQIEQRL